MIIIFLYLNHNYKLSKFLYSSHKTNKIKFDSEQIRNTIYLLLRLEKEYKIPNLKETKEPKSVNSNE